MRPYLRNPLTDYLRYLLNRMRNRRRFVNFDQGYMTLVTGTVCGPNFRVDQWSTVTNCEIGAYTYVSHDTEIFGTRIGRFCSIGPGCRIGVGLHPTDQISTSPVFFSTKQQAGMSFVSSNAFEENRKIEIGNDVWVGANAVVLDGVVVGTGAIVAAGAVVTRDVAPYTIVAGIPAQPRRMRFSAERVEILLRSRWWDWSAEKLGKYAPQFADAECFIDQVLRNGDEI